VLYKLRHWWLKNAPGLFLQANDAEQSVSHKGLFPLPGSPYQGVVCFVIVQALRHVLFSVSLSA
jgi:hypothetical protein